MVHYRKSSISDLIYIEKSILVVGWEDDFVCRTLKLGSHHGRDIRCLGRQNLVAPDSSTKVRCHSILTNCKHSALIFPSIIKKIFFKLSTGNISKETVAGSKHGHKKEKTKKISLLYIIKTIKRNRKKGNLNEEKLGLEEASFEKENVHTTRRCRICMYQIENIISGIWLLK